MTDITALNLKLLNARSEAMDAFVQSQKVACGQFMGACSAYNHYVWLAEQDFQEAAEARLKEVCTIQSDQEEGHDEPRHDAPLCPTSGSGSTDKEGEEGSERPKKAIKTK